MELAKREKGLQAEIRAARARQAQRDRDDPARHLYRLWLAQRAEMGDPEALLELRCQCADQDQWDERRRGAVVVVVGLRMEVILLDTTDHLRHRVHHNGDVSYVNQAGLELLRDTQYAIYVMDLSDDTIELAIRLALKRFGNGHFDVDGDRAFIAAVMRVAAEREIDVTFHDPVLNDRLRAMRAGSGGAKSLPAPEGCKAEKAKPK